MLPTDLVGSPEVCRWIATTNSVPDLEDLRDRVRAVEVYFHAQRATLDDALHQLNEAVAVRLRIELRLGELLRAIPPGGDRRLRAGTAGQFSGSTRALPDGITPAQAKVWRDLAEAVPGAIFERYLAVTAERSEERTREGLRRFAAMTIRTEEDLIDDGPSSSGNDEQAAPDDAIVTVKLVMTAGQRTAFYANCKTLEAQFKTTNRSETVLAAIEEALRC